MSTEFWITSLVVVLLPGTGVLYTIAYGIGRGFLPSVVAALGCTLGIVPHILASVLGLAAILHTSAVLFQAVKYAGVLYLFYMAWGMLRSGGPLTLDGSNTPAGFGKIVTSGFLINILNPKLSVFFLAFLPQFVTPHAASPLLEMFGLGALFMALTFIVFVGYGYLAATARAHIITKPTVLRWMKNSFAGAFALLGLRLAFAEQR